MTSVDPWAALVPDPHPPANCGPLMLDLPPGTACPTCGTIPAANRGDWMQTFTGKAFYPMAPHHEEVDPKDIAHALSLLCRYGGHVDRFYSVAEHCVLMSRAVSPENALWALLHDATEAYMGDMIRPLKRQMPAYVEAEDQLMTAVCFRFGIDLAMPLEVHDADSRILHDERAALLGPSPRPWNPVLEAMAPLGVRIEGWQPNEAEFCYLDRFYELSGECS